MNCWVTGEASSSRDSLRAADRNTGYAVACQFGLMFFEDKRRAMGEAFRVLRPGGRLVLSVWDEPAANPFLRLAQDAIAGFFDSDPPQFLELPWSFHDRRTLEGLAVEAGFEGVTLETVAHVSERPTARDAATGLVTGNPTVHDVRDRAQGAVEDVVTAVAASLSEAFGEAPIRVPMQAIVLTATRPVPASTS